MIGAKILFPKSYSILYAFNASKPLLLISSFWFFDIDLIDVDIVSILELFHLIFSDKSPCCFIKYFSCNGLICTSKHYINVRISVVKS